MFSKALFKQSCKANGAMWGIITFAVCFMLACVMLISGNGNIGEVKNSIQDTIIAKEIDAQMEQRALSYYADAENGLKEFDELFAADATDTLSALMWCSQMPQQSDYPDTAVYAQAVEIWQAAQPEMATEVGAEYLTALIDWLAELPAQDGFSSVEEYMAVVQAWQEATPATQENAVAAAYAAACEELQTVLADKADELGYDEDSTEAQEILGSVMYTLNPNNTFDDFYSEHGEESPEDYDVVSLLSHISDGTLAEYSASEERSEYRQARAEEGAAVFLAGNMTTMRP